MSVITALPIIDGATAHVTAQVLDQYGSVMSSSVPTISDSGPFTSFAPDAGTTGAGIVSALSPGADTMTAAYLGLTATLIVTVTPAPSVATSIQFVTP